MAIPDHMKKNFETLKRAFAAGDVALMECKLLDSDEFVDTICTVSESSNGVFDFTPFAIMSPRHTTFFELLEPPYVDDEENKDVTGV